MIVVGCDGSGVAPLLSTSEAIERRKPRWTGWRAWTSSGAWTIHKQQKKENKTKQNKQCKSKTLKSSLTFTFLVWHKRFVFSAQQPFFERQPATVTRLPPMWPKMLANAAI
jgi:hypothetical protein